MGIKNHRRSYADWFNGRYRMLSVFILTAFLFVSSQQIFIRIQRPVIPKLDKIPAKIWQSWKVDALHFEERDLDRARTWARKNPSHRYELLTDYSAIPYVEEAFGCGPKGLCRPDIVQTYKDLNDNLKIIQADLLRYIIMYVDGGLWADIDVEDIQPIRSFIPKRFDARDVDMVIGIETDEPDLANHPVLGSKAASFCQWTFMCKPGLPVMMRLIENIMVWLHRLAAEQGKTVAELHLDFDEVLSGTGPSAFTAAILAEMSISEGEDIEWSNFHDLVDSQLVGGVLVLPSEAFAAGTGHSRSGNHKGSRALVKHHFHASSWTDKHQRFKHPVYDEIEKCNWDAECVALWDSNVAFYNSLPEDEQLKMIELKRIDDAKEKKLAKAKADAAQKPIKEEKEEEKEQGPSEGKIPAAAQDKPDKKQNEGSPPKVEKQKEPALKDLKKIKDKPDIIKIQKENTEKKEMPKAKVPGEDKDATQNAAPAATQKAEDGKATETQATQGVETGTQLAQTEVEKQSTQTQVPATKAEAANTKSEKLEAIEVVSATSIAESKVAAAEATKAPEKGAVENIKQEVVEDKVKEP
ncbi:hypothetical protein AC578_7447 [Pseudocercospora eumusae]|uniref:Glycosyltransferase family 32 protein n=1 Tax=Pseudocercospora eumusae TaxID=321146 RepID=A0A139H8Z5_9PEZI|nr:hypothetical protein AC578_7447 [Pseudocercospora eumusae]